MARRPVKTERYFAFNKSHVRLKILPHGEDEATVVEARRKREGDEQWSRARHHEKTEKVAKMGLDAETIEKIERLRAKMEK